MDIIEPIKKNVIIDASILSTLMSCGCLTNYKYNLNLIPLGGKSNSLEVGSLAHKIFEVFNKARINGVSRKDAIDTAFVAGDMYIRGCQYCTDFQPAENQPKPICGHAINEYPGLQNTPQESVKTTIGWKWVLTTCEQYFDYYKNDSWIPLEAEITKGEILYEDDEVRIMWKAKHDLIVDTSNGIYSVDYKTMKQRRDTQSLNNQFIGQCLITKTRSVWIDKIGWQTTLEPKDKFSRVTVSYTADRLLEWQSITLPFWVKMMLMYEETGYWPQNFTHCENKYGFCNYKGVCEADRDMRDEELKLNFKVGEVWNPTNEE